MSVLDRFRLDGKRLFITGGSRGLGREMALAIADAGADVVTDRPRSVRALEQSCGRDPSARARGLGNPGGHGRARRL